MNDLEWQAYLATLPPELADLAQHLMERFSSVLAADRAFLLGAVEQLERRLELVQREIETLNVRLDEWDGSRSRVVGE